MVVDEVFAVEVVWDVMGPGAFGPAGVVSQEPNAMKRKVVLGA